MCDTAAEVLGFLRKNNKGQTIENNPIIEQLSRTQKEYRIKNENCSNIEGNEREMEDIAKIIQNDNQFTAMFKAVK